MRFMNGFFPDTTQEADTQIGTYNEPQVLIKSRRMISIRGNRQGAKESFAYAATQFIGFKPSLARNVLECLNWLLVPSVILNVTIGLYEIGVSAVILLSIVGMLLTIFIGMFAYALTLVPSLSTPGGIRLFLVVLAVTLL